MFEALINFWIFINSDEPAAFFREGVADNWLGLIIYRDSEYV